MSVNHGGNWHRRKTASVILHVLFSTYMWVSGAQIHDPAVTESAGNSGTIQSREIWEGCSSSVCEYCNSSIVTCLLKSFHFLCNESLKYNNRQFPTSRSPSQHDKYVRETSAGPHVFSITNVLAFLNRQWHIGQCVTVGKIPSQVKPVFNLQMATKLVQALFP